MSDEVRGILVGHGKLAEGLLDALDDIAGSQDALKPLDNHGMSPETLEARLVELMADGGPTVIFVDLPSGSCAYAARRLQVGNHEVAVVCGVNLPLLLDFIFHRTLSLAEIVERLRTHVGVSIEHSTDADSSVPR